MAVLTRAFGLTAQVLILGLLTSVLWLLLVDARRAGVARGLTRRRLRATLRLAEGIDRAVPGLVRRQDLKVLKDEQVRVHRQVREESAELSRQLAAMRVEFEDRLGSVTTDLTAWRHDLEANGQGACGRHAKPEAPPDLARVPGQELLEHLTSDGGSPASVVLVLDSFTPGQFFAGVRTALDVGAQVAGRLGRPLRLVIMRQPEATLDELATMLAPWMPGTAEGEARVRISIPSHPDLRGHHPDDVWVVTYWATAFALSSAVRGGAVRAGSVIYLVQDFEPGFFPWGTQYAMARSTYDLGFHLLVNSSPLARYLGEQTGQSVPAEHVFAPRVDQQQLRSAAARWRPCEDPTQPRVFFYARPSKPRNLFALGVSALDKWLHDLAPEVRPIITVAGEDLEPFHLDGADVVLRGKLSLDEYFVLLGEQDLALALMHSPHPSHLPLELPMAGIPTVTNAFGSYREPWVNGLLVASENAASLAEALERSRSVAATLRLHSPQELPARLGWPLTEAVAAVVTELDVSGSGR
jgi:hypothetical protein